MLVRCGLHEESAWTSDKSTLRDRNPLSGICEPVRYEVGSNRPSCTSGCDVFHAAIIVPGPTFYVGHIKNIDEFCSESGESLLNVRNHDAGTIKILADGD